MEIDEAVAEIERLRRQVDDLQKNNTQEVERRRCSEAALKARKMFPTWEQELKRLSAGNQAMHDVLDEYERCIAKWPPFASRHEGFAILKEEVDELWDEVKRPEGEHKRIRFEAKQVAAMAVRMMVECDE